MKDKTTPQIEILINSMVGQEVDGSILPNPFYRRSKADVRSNLAVAEEVYPKVFRRFIGSWFVNGDRNNPPPCSWENFEI